MPGETERDLRERIAVLENRVPDSDGKFRMACKDCGKIFVLKSLDAKPWFLCAGDNPDNCAAAQTGGVRRIARPSSMN